MLEKLQVLGSTKLFKITLNTKLRRSVVKKSKSKGHNKQLMTVRALKFSLYNVPKCTGCPKKSAMKSFKENKSISSFQKQDLSKLFKKELWSFSFTCRPIYSVVFPWSPCIFKYLICFIKDNEYILFTQIWLAHAFVLCVQGIFTLIAYQLNLSYQILVKINLV